MGGTGIKEGLGQRRDLDIGWTGIKEGLGYRRDWEVGGTGVKVRTLCDT